MSRNVSQLAGQGLREPLRILAKRLHWRMHLARKAVSRQIFRGLERVQRRTAAESKRHQVSITLMLLRLHLKTNCASAELVGINLRGLNLRGVTFRGANLSKALLDAGTFEADLTDAKLHRAIICGLDLSNLPAGIDFDQVKLVDLRCSDREHSSKPRLRGADLRGANLTGVNLRAADLRSVDLSGADLSSARLEWVDLGGRANLRGANLQRARLRGANLAHADLIGANLRHAELRDANLWNADLQMADLTDADLRGAIRDVRD